MAKTEEIRQLLTIAFFWRLWELESPTHSNFLQWLPEEILEDVIPSLLNKKSLQLPPLGVSRLSFLPKTTVCFR